MILSVFQSCIDLTSNNQELWYIKSLATYVNLLSEMQGSKNVFICDICQISKINVCISNEPIWMNNSIWLPYLKLFHFYKYSLKATYIGALLKKCNYQINILNLECFSSGICGRYCSTNWNSSSEYIFNHSSSLFI